MATSTSSKGLLLETERVTKSYPEARVIVLDDDVNTYESVATSLMKILPGMTEDKAWALAKKVDKEGSAEVWSGPLEQAELYHQQLSSAGLTMAPIERI